MRQPNGTVSVYTVDFAPDWTGVRCAQTTVFFGLFGVPPYHVYVLLPQPIA